VAEHRRTTRTCTLDELRPELAEAIRAHAQRQHWTNFEADILACCETTTENIVINVFDAWLNGSAAPLTYLALIATPKCASKFPRPNLARVSPSICTLAWRALDKKRADGLS
jgi:hypothetical protein